MNAGRAPKPVHFSVAEADRQARPRHQVEEKPQGNSHWIAFCDQLNAVTNKHERKHSYWRLGKRAQTLNWE